MKLINLLACVAGVSFSVFTASLSATAATPQPTRSAASGYAIKSHAREPYEPSTPHAIKVSADECPVIPKSSILSQNAQRLFETLTDVCLMKTSGVITEEQFVSIRDQVVAGINIQLATDMALTTSPPPASSAAN